MGFLLKLTFESHTTGDVSRLRLVLKTKIYRRPTVVDWWRTLNSDLNEVSFLLYYLKNIIKFVPDSHCITVFKFLLNELLYNQN